MKIKSMKNLFNSNHSSLIYFFHFKIIQANPHHFLIIISIISKYFAKIIVVKYLNFIIFNFKKHQNYY